MRAHYVRILVEFSDLELLFGDPRHLEMCPNIFRTTEVDYGADSLDGLLEHYGNCTQDSGGPVSQTRRKLL